MNRIIASVGLVALGAASVQAQTSTPIEGPASKWWNVSATVRGFYDDNINHVQHAGSADAVYGYELTPQVGISLGNDQTTFVADYRYAFLYYDKRPFGNTQKYDQDHTFDMALTHAFNERYSVRVRDEFVVGQEPEALRYDSAFHTPYRVSGDNIVNSGGIAFKAELTPQLGAEIGYDNAYYDYADTLSLREPGKNLDGAGNVISPSISGTLDRIEQMPHISALWHVMPDTTASLSYQYQDIQYTGGEVISGNVGSRGTSLVSRDRDLRSHTVYLGLDHQFRPDFYGSVQAGGSYYDYYVLNETSFGPYARLSLTWVYMLESSLTAGFQESRAATDVIGAADTKGHLTTDAEDSVVFATVRQRIVPNLFANLNGSFQRSAFNGGGPGFNGKIERFYELGANLEYVFNPHISVHAGYDFDRLDSELGNRTYSRNKVYVGATASY